MAKYGVQREGWDLPNASHRSSTFWKGLMSIKDSFIFNIKLHVGNGGRTLFWLDLWVDDTPLARQFSELFQCVKDKKASVQSLL